MSKKTIVYACWAVLLVGGATALVVSLTISTDRSVEAAVPYDFDIVSGPIQPLPLTAKVDPDKAALGRRLFNEPNLSAEGSAMSCATCHKASEGGAERLRVSLGADGVTEGKVNAPTVLNAAFNVKQFWDGRADTLEDQIEGPVLSELEMGITWDEAIARLNADASYRAQFEAIYGDGVNVDNIKDAIATFERTLITPNSPFDQFLRGRETALTEPQREGYELFEELGCVACHQGVNIGGNLFQKMGKMRDYFADRPVTEADLGRFNVTGKERDRFVFKVPTLRNIELTAPYFHDGSAETLEEAILVMGRVQLGYELSTSEVEQLVVFLKSLTGDLPEM